MARYEQVGRYKRMGDLVVVAPSRKPVEEVTARELNRNTAGVLAGVRSGRRAIVTRHGAPVAVLMEVEEAVGLCGMVLLEKRAAERRLFGDELEAELRQRGLRRVPRVMGGSSREGR
jgi:prevent-host-death family protein